MKTMTAIELIADTLRTSIVECGVSDTYPPVSQLMWLMRNLKLDFEDVYQAYLEKNKVNHQRQDRGY